MIEALAYFAGREPILFVMLVTLATLFVFACFKPWKRHP